MKGNIMDKRKVNLYLKSFFENIEDYIIAILLSLMTIFLFFQVFSRYVMTQPLVWTEEASRYTYIWIAMLCMAVGAKQRSHLAINFFVNLIFSEKIKIFLSIIINFIAIAMLIYFIPQSIRYCIFVQPIPTPALRISRMIVALALPVGYGFALIRFIIVLIQDIKSFRKLRLQNIIKE
jgi:TRAP-type C4-dicarboxylate transport system permease small subunit